MMKVHSRIDAHVVSAIKTQPVVQAKTEQRTGANHSERAFPQIQPLGKGADAIDALVALKKIDDMVPQHKAARQRYNQQTQAAQPEYSLVRQ
jgi:hypothetical protein